MAVPAVMGTGGSGKHPVITCCGLYTSVQLSLVHFGGQCGRMQHQKFHHFRSRSRIFQTGGWWI